MKVSFVLTLVLGLWVFVFSAGAAGQYGDSDEGKLSAADMLALMESNSLRCRAIHDEIAGTLTQIDIRIQPWGEVANDKLKVQVDHRSGFGEKELPPDGRILMDSTVIVQKGGISVEVGSQYKVRGLLTFHPAEESRGWYADYCDIFPEKVSMDSTKPASQQWCFPAFIPCRLSASVGR